MIFDSYDLPLHEGDGGDCLANVGRIAVLKMLALNRDSKDFGIRTAELVNEYRLRINYLMTDEKLRRHPIQWNHPDDVSSDQTEPIMLANLILFEQSRNQLIYNNYKTNGWRSQNGDLPRLHHLSIWGRYHDNHTLIYIGDFFLFLFVLFRRLAWIFQPNSVSNDVNLELFIRVFMVRFPTFLTRLARKIYKSDHAIRYYFVGVPSRVSELSKYMVEAFERGNE